MKFWRKLRKALNFTGKAAQVASILFRNQKTSKVIAGLGEVVATETEEKPRKK